MFTPGPVKVTERVLSELSKPNDTHRSNPYYELHAQTCSRLQQLLYTKNDVLLFASSGTGVMEACVQNLLAPGEKGLFLTCGAFGDRWVEIARSHGKAFEQLEFPWGTAVRPDAVKEALEGGDYPVAFVQFNETSTGVRNPLEKIAPVVKEGGALLCVDAVSGMAGMKIDVDAWGIDVCLASTQKCFGLPPGMAVASVSEAAYEKAEGVEHRGYYFDLLVLRRYGQKNQTPNTPPIPLIRALNAQLRHVLEVEGLENRFARHAALGERVRKWAAEEGLEMYSEDGSHSDTVAAISNTRNVDLAKFVANVEARGYRIVNGYGSLAGKNFRVGFMGDVQLDELEELLVVLSEELRALG